ncbi:coiled-coil domain-containing protein [Ophiostoma piceae UAMH 11346]|uniref:Coiled-coil domain-containing protein n=1 Tax=Ophiostoma piceae (strain UAMH 11346) TaxID=1262450 RepID=S3CTQ8_OPHP1|nr:coiled-coil domain-containing protein [Ophiostoma piceae UAMH 11346]
MDQPMTGTPLPARPQPRPGRPPQEIRRIRTKNRRLEYLRRNPSYLESSDREFVSGFLHSFSLRCIELIADVTLYNTLIRSFQTPAERSAEARDKGFGQVLEASILRNPEPLQRMDDDDIVEEEDEEDEEDETSGKDGKTGKKGGQQDEDVDMDDTEDDEGTPAEVARRRWYVYVREWFVRGAAEEDGFDYTTVDEDSEYDTLARADEQDAWFDEEEPGWAESEAGGRELTGQTGVQDY